MDARKELTIGKNYILKWFDFIFIGKLEQIVEKSSCRWIKRKEKGDEMMQQYYDAKNNQQILVLSSCQKEIANRGIIEKIFEGKRKQFYFTSPIVSKENIIEAVEYDWFIKKMSDVPFNRKGDANLDINLRIAESMIRKKGIDGQELKLFLNELHSKGLEIILEKQKQFEAHCEFQENQLPFKIIKAPVIKEVEKEIEAPVKIERTYWEQRWKKTRLAYALKLTTDDTAKLFCNHNDVLCKRMKNKVLATAKHESTYTSNLTKDCFCSLMFEDDTVLIEDWDVQLKEAGNLEKGWNFKIKYTNLFLPKKKAYA